MESSGSRFLGLKYMSSPLRSHILARQAVAFVGIGPHPDPIGLELPVDDQLFPFGLSKNLAIIRPHPGRIIPTRLRSCCPAHLHLSFIYMRTVSAHCHLQPRPRTQPRRLSATGQSRHPLTPSLYGPHETAITSKIRP